MKRIFSLISLMVLVFILAACKGDSDVIELVVWESTLGPDEFIRQAGKKYSELHPNIKIKYVNVELGNAAGQIALDGPAGVGADLFAAPHDKLGELVNGGHILPTVDSDDVRSQVLEAAANALTYDGVMYGYPVATETYALFYNKDYVSDDKVPKTWAELKEFARNFNVKDVQPFVMDVGNGYYTIIFTTGGGTNLLFGPDGTDVENTRINNEIAVNGMKIFQGLREVIDIPSGDLSTSVADGALPQEPPCTSPVHGT